jgi:hypothetical protein
MDSIVKRSCTDGGGQAFETGSGWAPKDDGKVGFIFFILEDH